MAILFIRLYMFIYIYIIYIFIYLFIKRLTLKSGFGNALAFVGKVKGREAWNDANHPTIHLFNKCLLSLLCARRCCWRWYLLPSGHSIQGDEDRPQTHRQIRQCEICEELFWSSSSSSSKCRGFEPRLCLAGPGAEGRPVWLPAASWEGTAEGKYEEYAGSQVSRTPISGDHLA